MSGRRTSAAVAVALIAFSLVYPGKLNAEGPTPVCGAIHAENNFWTLQGSPYVICTGDGGWAETDPGVTLIIDAGVQVQGGALSGDILADGAVFTNAALSGSLLLADCTLNGTSVEAYSGVILRCHVMGAGIWLPGPVSVLNSTVDGAGIGISIGHASAGLNHCTVENCTDWGVVASVDAQITDCTIRNNKSGLHLWGVTPDLTGTTFSGNQDYDVYLMGQAWGQYFGDLTLRSMDGVSKVGIAADHYSGQVYWNDGTLRLEGPMQVIQSSSEGECNIAAGGALVANGVTFTWPEIHSRWGGISTIAAGRHPLIDRLPD